MTNSDASIIVLPVDTRIDLDVTKNGSPADGKSVNTAIASLDNESDSITGIVFRFEIIEGDAKFVLTGNKQIDVKANPAMAATADFTDFTGEVGKIKAYPVVKNDLVAVQDYTFINILTNLTLKLTSDDNVFADSKSIINVQATLLDTSGNPAPLGTKLVFTLPGTGAVSFSDASKKITLSTDKNGQASVKVLASSQTDITALLTCTLDGATKPTTSLNLHFKAYIPVQKFTKLALKVTKNGAKADGSSTDEVTAIIADASRNPGKNIELALTIPNSSPATFKAGGKQLLVSTDSNGQAKAEIVATSYTDVTSQVSVAVKLNPSVTVSTNVTFTADTSGLTLSLAPTHNNAPANGAAVNTVTATLKDRTGKVVANQLLNFTLNGASSVRFDNGQTTTQGTTNSSGQVSVNLTDNSKQADSVTVYVALGINSNIKANTIVTFAYVAPAVSTPNWPIVVVAERAEGVYGPTNPMSTNYYRCEIYIANQSQTYIQYNLRITNGTSIYTLSDANGGIASSLVAGANQTVFVGILKNQYNDTGASLEIRSMSGVVVWRGIIYPRTHTLKITN